MAENVSVASGAGFSGIGSMVSRPSSLAGSRPSKQSAAERASRAWTHRVAASLAGSSGPGIGCATLTSTDLSSPTEDADTWISRSNAVPLECRAPARSDAEPAPIGGRVSGLDPGPDQFDLRKRFAREYAGIAAAGHGDPLKTTESSRAAGELIADPAVPQSSAESKDGPPQGIVNPEPVFRHSAATR